MINRYLHQIIRAGFLFVAILVAGTPAYSWAAAGYFQFISGDVRVVGLDGRERTARKGDEINEKESVLTGRGGSAQLRMEDGGILAVRAETSLRVEEYKYSGKADGSEKSLFSLLKGGFRAITGVIGRVNKENYGIRTPSATIGIRGTDHETVHLSVAMPNLPVGTYNKVNVGATTVNGTFVGPNQVAYASGLGIPAVILPAMPSIFEAPKAAPQGKEDKKKAGDGGNGDAQKSGEKKSSEADNKPRSSGGKDSEQKTGEAAPAPRTAPPPPGGLMGSTLIPPPPPPPIIITTNTSTGGVAGGANTFIAPIGYGGVGGDLNYRTENISGTPTYGLWPGSGSIVVEGPNQLIVIDSNTKLPVLLVDASAGGDFKYVAGTAQFVDAGITSVDGATVAWGRYVGADTVIDKGVASDPKVMLLMMTDKAMSFVQTAAYFFNNSKTLSTPVGGNVVDENGILQTLTSGSLQVATSGALGGNQVTLNLAGTGTRAFALQYIGSLQQFAGCNSGSSCGIPIQGASTLGGTATTWLKGDASGVFVGPNAAGALVSFSGTSNASQSVLGTVLLK